MKYIIAILLVAILVFTACEQARDFIPEDPIIDDDDDDINDEVSEDELLPELVDEDDDVEIGEMI